MKVPQERVRAMTTILVQLTALTIVLMASQPRASRAQGSIGSWLDEPELASWNTPGRVIPMAPPIEGGTDPRCRETARPPQTKEDTQVGDWGWTLVGAYQGGWQMLVIRARLPSTGCADPASIRISCSFAVCLPGRSLREALTAAPMARSIAWCCRATVVYC